mgnify:CR=1 FL=1
MYEEFFNYIATRIIGYFEQECDNLHDGDRFCFKLDNGELVEQVNAALNDITLKKDIQGTFSCQEKKFYNLSYRIISFLSRAES